MNRIFLDNLIYFFYKTLNFTDIPVATEPVTTQPTLHYQIHTLQVPQSRQSARLSLQSSELAPAPPPHPQASAPPPFGSRGRGDTLACEREGGGRDRQTLCMVLSVQYNPSTPGTSREKQHRKADKKRLLVFSGEANCLRSLVKHFSAFSSRDPSR